VNIRNKHSLLSNLVDSDDVPDVNDILRNDTGRFAKERTVDNDYLLRLALQCPMGHILIYMPLLGHELQ